MGIDEIAPSTPPEGATQQSAQALPEQKPITSRTELAVPPALSGAKRDRLDRWKDVTATIQAVATVIALGVAAWWFFQQGIAAPHANLTESVETLQIHDKWRLVTLNVRIANVGVVPITMSSGRVYIARVLPLEDTILQKIDRGSSPIDTRSGQIGWPAIGDPYDIAADAEIWPGESESYNFDFLIPTDICEVMLYSRFTSKENPDLIWSESTLQKVGECANEH